jgi:hypothetical protein
MSLTNYKAVFWKTLFSPKYYWLFTESRFRDNYINVPLDRRLMSIVYALTTIGLLYITQAWLVYIVAWVIPSIILYPMSALFQFCTEHLWGSANADDTTKSHARFCGEDPPTNNTVKDWSWWWLKILLYHLPIRVAVLSAELITHDIHHILPKEDKADWSNIIYARQRLVEAGLVKSDEHWGIHNAAKAVFQNLAEQKPLTQKEIDQIINTSH